MTLVLPEAYPLAWPDGWPRKTWHQRRLATYRTEFGRARDHLLNELRLGRSRHVILSSNVPLRRDGLPLASMREPTDPGVAVYWDDPKGNSRVIACDVWSRVKDNLHAVGLAIESLRALERTGATELLERAYSGFKRLPAPAPAPVARPWWEVLGLNHGAYTGEVQARFRELAREHHPDRGGDVARFAEITAAYHEAMNE